MDMGALFDWDGVVIDSSRQHEKSWEDLAREAGLPLPDNHFRRGFGMKNQVIIPEILGWTDDPGQIEDLGRRKEEIYRERVRRDGIAPLPGVLSLLEMLANRGVPCCVASSSPRANIDAVIEAIGAGAYFSGIVSAEDVSHGKPDPEVFLKSAATIGCYASDCVVFEDALVGIRAGQAAGSKVIAVATTHPLEELAAADLAVESLEQVDWHVFSSLLCRATAQGVES
jgi:HAD superfamily hydrolase (TIGR01509 family)